MIRSKYDDEHASPRANMCCSNFAAPWDYPTSFAQPTFTLPLVDGSWRDIIHFDNNTIFTNITGLAN